MNAAQWFTKPGMSEIIQCHSFAIGPSCYIAERMKYFVLLVHFCVLKIGVTSPLQKFFSWKQPETLDPMFENLFLITPLRGEMP